MSSITTKSEYYILVKELTVEKVTWSISLVNYSRPSQTDLSKGELLIRNGDLMYVKGNEGATFKFEGSADNVAPLDVDVQLGLLEAIPTPKGRFYVFVTAADERSGWLDWGAAVKAGDSVYIRVPMKDGSECCSTARVHYIGRLTEDQPGTMFGVEITDSRYYGCGTTDGTYKEFKYFHCPDNNGLFLSLASVAKEPQWLKLQYQPRKDIPQLTEGKQTDQDIPPTAAKRSNKEQSYVSASPNVGVNKGNDTNQLPIGTRVILASKVGGKVKGTVRLAGHLSLDDADPKEKIPVYGVETDAMVNWRDFEPVISLMGRPVIHVSSGHGKVFIPQSMVELDEQIDGSDINVKNTAATKDEPKLAGGKFEESRQAALEKEKKKEKEKAELTKILGPEIAGQTNIDEQLRILEECKKAKQREDNISADRGVLTGVPSTDRQYPAAQQNYPQSSSHLGRQSSSTQDPYQLSHSQPSSVPLQSDWSSPLVVGSAVIIPTSNPPIYGTIRWIGTVPQVLGYAAGVELDSPMEGCSDGTWSLDGTHYFTCQPNRGYYCLLKHLIPDQRFIPDKESYNPVHDQDEAKLTIRLNEIQEQLAQEKKISQKYKEERDLAMKERDQAMKDRDQAMKDRDQAMKDRDQAMMFRDQAMKGRDQAMMFRDQAMKDKDQAMKDKDQAMKDKDQVMKKCDQVMKELEALTEEHSQCKAFWIVPRHHVTVLEKSLGGGAWGYVKEGKFRGQQVAVKCVHETIITQHTIKRVYREICTMSQVRHPNLVLSMAAVLDDQGGPMIITELLDTTLRKAYEDSLLNVAQCMDIFRDVACALCYLHELEAPIIHRDVSSSNVLLKAVAKDQWKAKLSDFGSANWAKEASTMGEGAIVYTAPEAYPPHPSLDVQPPPQTTKIDVYSYGILLCEVTLREFPNPATLREMKAKMKAKNDFLHSLMLKCIQAEPTQRPTMATILKELN